MAELTKEQALAMARARRRRAEEAQRREAMTHQPKPEPQPESTVPTGEGVLRAGFQGATFGFGDEIVAGGAAAIHPLVNPDDGSNFSERYDHYLSREREKLGEFQDKSGLASGAAEIAGAIPTALMTGGASLVGRGAIGTAIQGGKLGAIDGAIYGAGTAEGGAEERLKGAGVGAGIGAGVGAASPFIAAGAQRAGQAVADPIMGIADALSGRGSVKRASRSISRTMDRAGMDASDISRELAAASADGQGVYRIADALGNSGQRTLSGVARQPGNMRDEIVKFLNKRQDGQAERLSSFLAEGLDAPDTALQRQTALEAQREAQANVLYGRARESAGAVNLNGAIDVLNKTLRRDPILGDTALSQGEMGRRLSGLRDRLQKDGEQLVDFQEIANIKSDLFNTMQSNPRAAKDLRAVYSALDEALEAASPDYRIANDTYRQASTQIDDIGRGKAAASPRRREADTLDEIGRLQPLNREAYRVGYADDLIGRIEGQAPGANSARPLTSPKRESELAALANDPAKLKRQIDRESVMFETRRQATGGSQTADNLADQADVNGQVGIIANLLRGNLGGAAGEGARAMGRTAAGMNEATRDIIARAMLSNNPREALAPVLQQALRDQKTRKVVEALLRTGGNRLVIN